MIRFFINMIILSAICCSASYAVADTTVPIFADENIHIKADRMNQNLSENIYTADGNVVVTWKGMNLTADSVRYVAGKHLLYANGSVLLSKDATLLKGAALVLNMDTGEAEIDPAVLSISESNMTMTSEKLTRINDKQFTSLSTELTTCDMPDPSWKFRADKVNISLQEYATGRNVIFYVKDVPVLYLPWFAFPIATEKKSGFLFPHLGYSKKRGGQLDIPYYWVISPSQDLQFDLDILSMRGEGTGIHYRYIRNRNSEGDIAGYQIYDRVANRWRWEITQQHKEIFSSSANLRMNVTTTSDRLFLSDFGEKSGDYNRQSTETIINGLKTWQNFAATSHLRYNDALYNENNRSTLQTLPSVGLSGVRQQLFSAPLFFDLDSSASNLYKRSGSSGQRLYMFPRITLLPIQNRYLQTSIFAGAHIRGYYGDNQDKNGAYRKTDGDILPESGLRLSTSITRIYNSDMAHLKKLRHEIVPEARYAFVPERDQQRLPFYDYTDRMIYRNMISLSVTSFLNGKFTTGDISEYRDLSRIKISADYAIDGGRRDLLTLVDSQHLWSDLNLESETWLTKQLRLTFDSRYNFYEKVLSTAVAGVELNDKSGNLIGAGYQMARNEVEYLEGRVATRFIRPVNLSYTARYSFDRNDFLESVYTAEYRHKCWSFNMAVHQRPGNNMSYSVNFNLAGLGSK